MGSRKPTIDTLEAVLGHDSGTVLSAAASDPVVDANGLVSSLMATGMGKWEAIGNAMCILGEEPFRGEWKSFLDEGLAPPREVHYGDDPLRAILGRGESEIAERLRYFRICHGGPKACINNLQVSLSGDSRLENPWSLRVKGKPVDDIKKALRALGLPDERVPEFPFDVKWIIKGKKPAEKSKPKPAIDQRPAPPAIKPQVERGELDALRALGLSVRAVNCLWKHGARDLNDLAFLTQKDLMAIRGMGRTTVFEIVAVCKRHGVTIPETFDPSTATFAKE